MTFRGWGGPGRRERAAGRPDRLLRGRPRVRVRTAAMADRPNPPAGKRDKPERGRSKKDLMGKGAALEEVRTGMRAAGSGVGGQGLNTVPSTGTRSDGLLQETVMEELAAQVEELRDLEGERPDDPVFQKPNEETLSKYEIICNRQRDLENWLGREDAPVDMALDRDENGVIRLRYDGELRGTVPEEGGGDGIFVRHGHATVRMGNGTFFEGVFHDGAPQGNAVLVFPNEDRWEGNFDRGRLHGHGTYTWARPMGHPQALKWRKKYIGWLEDGRIESQGRPSTFILNKQIYEGEFRDGVAHGKGVMLWADGHHYDGEWVDGRAQGDGVLTLVDGTEKKGPFVPCRSRLPPLPASPAAAVRRRGLRSQELPAARSCHGQGLRTPRRKACAPLRAGGVEKCCSRVSVVAYGLRQLH